MPETLRQLIDRVRTRLRARAVAHAITIGGAVFALLLIVSLPIMVSAFIAMLATGVLTARRWRISGEAIAYTIERNQPLDNLLITAAELDDRPRPVAPAMRDAIWQQADERAAAVDPRRIVVLGQPVAVAAAVLIGCVLIARTGNMTQLVQQTFSESTGSGIADGDISVRVTPPPYTRKPVETHTNPTQITVISGSRLRIEGASRVIREWVATASESLELRIPDETASRFLSVVVVQDSSPSVRITEPGRDTAFAAPTTSLRVGIESRDDIGLASLTLRYTKASGGGENVTFVEGEVPLKVERVDERHWRASALWTLDGLGLTDGDVLVYRATSRDANPDGTTAESDAYLVEIGRTAEIASAGFALPTEERKYAISQQMVIYKTEQLIANRAKHPNDWLEQTRMIGMEQRMVRAEVVFLSGGEVQDEVEEAAHSHELAEGRLENQGRAEMVRALNFMSRAEAQLNDGNAAEALVFERQALASLERALDRRRYFLRTLPDRSRIDLTRRLSGERRDARSWLRPRAAAPETSVDRSQAAMRDLMAALRDPAAVNASLAARVGAVDPASPELQQAAIAIANAQSAEQRRQAVQAAMTALTSTALKTLPGSVGIAMPSDPLAGRLGDALAGRPR